MDALEFEPGFHLFCDLVDVRLAKQTSRSLVAHLGEQWLPVGPEGKVQMLLKSGENLPGEDRTGCCEFREVHGRISFIIERVLEVLWWWNMFSSLAETDSPCTPRSSATLLERKFGSSINKLGKPPIVSPLVLQGLLDLRQVDFWSASKHV